MEQKSWNTFQCVWYQEVFGNQKHDIVCPSPVAAFNQKTTTTTRIHSAVRGIFCVADATEKKSGGSTGPPPQDCPVPGETFQVAAVNVSREVLAVTSFRLSLLTLTSTVAVGWERSWTAKAAEVPASEVTNVGGSGRRPGGQTRGTRRPEGRGEHGGTAHDGSAEDKICGKTTVRDTRHKTRHTTQNSRQTRPKYK